MNLKRTPGRTLDTSRRHGVLSIVGPTDRRNVYPRRKREPLVVVATGGWGPNNTLLHMIVISSWSLSSLRRERDLQEGG